MNNVAITIKNSTGSVLAEASGKERATLVYNGEYSQGDVIELDAKEKTHLLIQLDDTLAPALVYFSGVCYRFCVPFGEKRIPYNPKSFTGNVHVLMARLLYSAEVYAYRNLALNSHDTADNKSCFPHAFANIETRGEAVFAARNAIDGNTANRGHGQWPYGSWGINRDPNAKLSLDFGRNVTVDKIVLVTRADFPHDNYWKKGDVVFSDGSSMTVNMARSAEHHTFAFAPKTISSLTLENLVQDTRDPSPFPALSQLEVYGQDAQPQ